MENIRKLESNNHSVFLLHYHLIMCVKYRRKVIDNEISKRLKETFLKIAPSYNINLDEWNHDIDHVHVLFRAHQILNYQSLSMPTNLKVPGWSRKSILIFAKSFGKKSSGHRVFV